MKFNKNGMRKSTWSGKRVYTHGTGKHIKDTDRVMEFSFEGMQKKLLTKVHISGFSYFDPEKNICKLCYESIVPRGSKSNGYVMINKLDGKPHRVLIGRNFYCKMAKTEEKGL